ncbi:MAG TPA: hypothetical protein VFO94_00665, partial [Gammaproteobacteria bacterium]|nr:hypothetical protein [Gammaproteobacteria bacterium]
MGHRDRTSRDWPLQNGHDGAALAAAIASADPGAEKLLIEAYGPALMYILERRTQSRSIAEDIYQ